MGLRSTPAVADLDADGGRAFDYCRNVGNARARQSASAPNPQSGVDFGLSSAAAFGDVDRDGGLDVVAGRQDGTFRTFTLPEPSASALLGFGGVGLG